METRFAVRDASIKKWATDLIEEQHLEWAKLFDAKMTDKEVGMKRDINSFKKGGGSPVTKSAKVVH